ncbi:C40 family peptidase [Pedobacter chinensis]|uniref:hypothetical protein n=1 Tax=Pedobacter chinensis TaxID=2282421 RepID=UPI0018F3BEDF|nr:hypothetical protein [Pedobacter chinensis]
MEEIQVKKTPGVRRLRTGVIPGKGWPHFPGLNSLATVPEQKALIELAQKELGVRERTGKNDGKRVEEYLQYVGFNKGTPWCAAFVSWVFGQAGYPQPRTAWSPALFPLSRQTQHISPAMVFGIYYSALKRIAH